MVGSPAALNSVERSWQKREILLATCPKHSVLISFMLPKWRTTLVNYGYLIKIGTTELCFTKDGQLSQAKSCWMRTIPIYMRKKQISHGTKEFSFQISFLPFLFNMLILRTQWMLIQTLFIMVFDRAFSLDCHSSTEKQQADEVPTSVATHLCGRNVFNCYLPCNHSPMMLTWE